MSSLTDIRFSHLHRITLAGLVLLVLSMTLLLLYQMPSGWKITTDLKALLPTSGEDRLLAAVDQHFAAAAENKFFLLIGANNKQQLLQAAELAIETLRQQPLLELISPSGGAATNRGTGDYASLIAELQAHRFHLLTPQQRSLLSQAQIGPILEDANRSLYQLDGWARLAPLTMDPLNLFNQYIAALKLGPENIYPQGEYLFVSPPDPSEGHFVLLSLNIKGSVFNLGTQTAVTTAVDTVETRLQQRIPSLRLLRSGIVFHAANAAEKAKLDLTLISTGSILGIIALFWFTYRSLKPLLISLTSIAFGCFAATLICHWLFGEIHLITLVFGASLIGVSVDYSLHFFSHLFSDSNIGERAESPMQRIFPALCLGLITSVIGYSCLLQSQLPGLQQIAVFSAVGLISVWLFVAGLYPFITLKANRGEKVTPLLQLASKPEMFWRTLGAGNSRVCLWLLLILALAISTGLLRTSNNPRTFYAPSPQLLLQEQRLHQLLDSYAPSQFYIVKGVDEQALLKAEEGFLEELEQLQARGAISGYAATSSNLPSIDRQRENYRLQRAYIYGEEGAAYDFMNRLGVDAITLEDLKHNFEASRENYLTPEQWLAQVGEPQRALWMGKLNLTAQNRKARHSPLSDSPYVSLITLRGIKDVDALASAARDYSAIEFVDKVENLKGVLKTQFHAASRVLIIAYVVVATLLLFYYRHLNALGLIIAPLLATLTTLTVFSLCAVALNLFHVFALFLVLGLGMDYSIFLRETVPGDRACLLAITLSALTSCLSFGLLSLSSTPMVQSFGITVLIGSLLNLAIAPAVRLGYGPRNNDSLTQPA